MAAAAPPKSGPLVPPPPFLPPDVALRKSLDGSQLFIEAVVFGTFMVYTTILILGRLRPRGNGLMKTVSTYAFMIGAYAISYIPGLMKQPSQPNELYVYWIAFMAYIASVANETSCYTLGDNEDRKKRLIVDYSVAWPLIIISVYKGLGSPNILVPTGLIFWLVVLKLRERTSALLWATRSSHGLSETTKIISDFTLRHKEETQTSVTGSDFLLGVREARQILEKKLSKKYKVISKRYDRLVAPDQTLITLQDVSVNFDIKTDQGKELNNICLSFTMFWLLVSKMAGYDDVGLKILCLNPQEKLTVDAFDLVGRELEFLYEYLFTNCYAIYARGLWKKFRNLGVTIVFLILNMPLLIEYRPEDHNAVYVEARGHVLDIGFTRFIILAIVAIEITQLAIFLSSKWAKVIYTCHYIDYKRSSNTTKKANYMEMLINFVFSIPRPRFSFLCFKTCTKRKMGQYSIVKSYHMIPCTLWIQCWFGSFVTLPRIGQAGHKFDEVPSNLKDVVVQAINDCLEHNGGKFTNGATEEFIKDYVQELKSQSSIILLWHIVTERLGEKATKKDKSFEVARVISKYCAYLVAFIPQLVAAHVYTTQYDFDDLVQALKFEATIGEENELKGTPKFEATTGKEFDLEASLKCDNVILKKARKLQRELEDKSDVWEILAEFWTEKLLFLALSDNGVVQEAHVNTLSIGGEFITHVRALALHAGCSL